MENFDLKKLSIGLGILLGLSGFAMIGVSYMQMDGLQAVYDENEKTIQDIKDDIESIDGDVADVEEVKAKIYSATQAGKEIADVQNQILAIANSDLIDTQKQSALSESVRYYFANSSKMMSWYSAPNVAWSFDTTYAYANKKIPVLWSCYGTEDKAHQTLYAWVTGVYDAETGLFDDVKIYTTAQGVRYHNQFVTDDMREDATPESLIDGKYDMDATTEDPNAQEVSVEEDSTATEQSTEVQVTTEDEDI